MPSPSFPFPQFKTGKRKLLVHPWSLTNLEDFQVALFWLEKRSLISLAVNTQCAMKHADTDNKNIMY